MVTIKKKLEMVTDTPKVSVSEILELIPESFIQKLATDLVVDKWAKKFTANAIFKLVLFSTLSSERLSLRVMEEKSSDPIFKSMVPALAEDKVTWGGIRDRLSKVDPIFFQRLYEYVYKMASDKYGSESLSKLHIKRYDSTMIATYAHLLSGMKVGNTSKNKTQVKFTTELKDDFLIKMTFHQDQPHLSEERALKEAVEKDSSKDTDQVTVFVHHRIQQTFFYF